MNNKQTQTVQLMIHKLHTQWVRNVQRATDKIVKMIFMNYINYCLHNINNMNGSIHCYSASESILLRHRLDTRRHEFQCFIWHVPLFHPCFWFVLFKNTQSCVFLCFVREFSHANVLFCVCFHACMTSVANKFSGEVAKGRTNCC